ncbi:MAG: GNAT family N-acetyltransferase [Caldilineaceae bacterium]
MLPIQIRLYRMTDLPGVEALEARVKPYRPQDQAAVEAMFERAKQAERQNDARWMAPSLHDSPTTPESYSAFWVATQQMTEGANEVIGTVAVLPFRSGVEMAPTHPLAQVWDGRVDVIELRRVRVAAEARGQGIGTQLCQMAIDWGQAQGYALMVVNTTTPQTPALRLYQRLGFQAVGISFIGKYELVWQELKLS